MSELEDVFGEEFAQHVQEKTAERRQERNRLTDEQMAEVAHLSISEGKFEEGDPQFTYTTDNGITHNILLMQVPDPDGGEVWEHLSEPWDGAARLPLEYLGQWYWSTFPEKKDVAELEQGQHVIVAGSIEEDEGDNGEMYYSIYPVRGVLSLNDAQELASKYEGDADFEEEEDPDEDFTDDSEQEETTSEEEETDSSDGGGLDFDSDGDGDSGSGGLDGLMGDDDDDEPEEEEVDDEDEQPVPYEDIAAKVEELEESQDPDEEPQVLEIEEGSEHLSRLASVVAGQLELDDEDAVAGVVIDVIQAHRDDEEEEEEDETNKLF